MKETKEFICIVCPYGCRLNVEAEDGMVTGVKGNICGRGKAYAQQEATNPQRVITSLMRAGNRQKPFSVKTEAPVPKALFFECVEAIRAARPKAPIRCGDVVISDILGTGVDVVSTQDVD